MVRIRRLVSIHDNCKTAADQRFISASNCSNFFGEMASIESCTMFVPDPVYFGI